MDERTINEAIQMNESCKGFFVDKDAKRMEIPFGKGTEKEDVMSNWGIGSWFVEKGFQVDFVTKDVEYMTKGSWINYRGAVRGRGHKAYLRNRLVMIVTW